MSEGRAAGGSEGRAAGGSERPRPDFVIIGAQKSGSTALMTMLGEHPSLYLPQGETLYFRDPWFDFQPESVLADAVATNKPGVLRRGIKCPDYLPSPTAPQRVRDVLGDVDLIAVLRDPVDRAISAYYWGMQWGWVPRQHPEIGLEDLLVGRIPADHPRADEILEYGHYAKHLRRWLEVFDSAKLRVLLDVDLKPAVLPATLASLYEFLGVDASIEQQPPARRVNEGVYSPLRLRLLSYRTRYIFREFPGYPGRKYLQPAQGVRGKLVNRSISALDRLVLSRTVSNEKPQLSARIVARLSEYYAPERAELETLLDRSLAAWR